MNKQELLYVKDCLQKMQDWYSGPEKWCRRTYWRDSDNRDCTMPRAKSACLAGCGCIVEGVTSNYLTPVDRFLDNCARERGIVSYISWNDECQDYTEVKAFLTYCQDRCDTLLAQFDPQTPEIEKIRLTPEPSLV